MNTPLKQFLPEQIQFTARIGRQIAILNLFLVLSSGSVPTTYEHTTFYIRASRDVEARLMVIAEMVANRHKMHVTKGELAPDREVESMFRATAGPLATWFGPSSTTPEFTVNLAFGFLRVSVYYPTNYQGKRTLISEFEFELEESGIEYSTEFPEELMGEP